MRFTRLGEWYAGMSPAQQLVILFVLLAAILVTAVGLIDPEL